MSRSSGVHIVRSLTWEVRDADIVTFCDACLSSMGFWYPNLNSLFFSVAPLDWLPLDTPRTEWILPFEFLCVVSALRHASFHAAPDSKVIIFTDSQNTVDIFGSLRATPRFNTLLRYAVDIIIDCSLHVRVLHIAGEHNVIADHLSRSAFSQAIACAGTHPCPLTIDIFVPPPVRLGLSGC